MATVIVQNNFDDALTTPTFLVKVTDPGTGDAVIYMTLALWEYDPAHATTQAQTDGCQAISDEYDLIVAGQMPGDPVVEAVIRGGPPGDGNDDINHTWG